MPLELNGYTAHVCYDGKELTMYDVKQEDGKTVSCWIPSEKDKAFTVHYGDMLSKAVMTVQTCIDGQLARSAAYVSKREGSCEGQYDRDNRCRPFIFSPLVVTDDETAASPKQKLDAGFGTIQVKMIRVKQFIRSGGTSRLSLDDIGVGPVHETSKKAGVHTVSLGEPMERSSAQPVAYYDAIGREKHPFATFIFRYRPLELLKANGIVPRPPKATKKRPLESQSELESGSATSARKKQREDVDDEKVKAEPASDVEDEEADDLTFLEEQLEMMQRRVEEKRAARRAKVIVKREPSPIRVPPSGNEVIDLT
ncbi:hypothetical protein PYCCODRAFT_1372578 [Trametes coccinea BRFM310]|uniref:DUF7918 domain-containing protein n=1 Tax=Trametes coccinea (strain BRFM310) TaxID=1353009 RepID=A0A1Y2IF57_TRAC3|nr:hypothetical protein PYCCODRAFT_1372578 [Trametes coccinea BRFM310]